MNVRIFLGLIALLSLLASMQVQAAIIELFDDDEGFVDSIPNQDAPTQIEADDTDPFNGEICVRLESDAAINNGQKYNPRIAGWAYKITKNPGADDEARWIMFAWKKEGGQGIMIQFPNNGSWGGQPNGGRYFAGVNKTGWPGIQVLPEAPAEWDVQIRDLQDDFGDFVLTGIALTQYDNVGYYDFIYLAWTEDKLKQLLNEAQPVEPIGKLAVTWADMKAGN